MLEDKDFPINSIWSICKSWINNPVHNNHDNSGIFVPNPSAMINSFHFLLGAMLSCSTSFCTSATWPKLTSVLMLKTKCLLMFIVPPQIIKFET